MRRVHVMVSGGVQGVGYRYTMRLIAQEQGAAGWVRNRLDGSVEAEVEAEPGPLDTVLAWMSEGPPGARVDAARVSERTPTGERGFAVRDTA